MDPYEYLLKKLNISTDIAPLCKNFLQLKFNNKFVRFFPRRRNAKFIFTRLHYFGEMDFTVDPEVRDIIKMISLFPQELESTEHVDLLLILNGLQTSDEISY